MSIQSVCIQICRHRFRFTLLANFDFYLCLRINFHTSSFWVLILAAGGPYLVLISQKNGSLSQSLGVFISFRDSEFWYPLLKLFLISQLPFRCLHSAKSNWIVLLITAWREVGNIISTGNNSLLILSPCSQVGLDPIVLHQRLDKKSIFLLDECQGTFSSSALHFDV